MNYLTLGGPLTVPLFLLSSFSLALFLQRWWIFHQKTSLGPAFLGGIRNLVRQQRYLEAIALCQEFKGAILSEVVRCALVCEAENPQMFKERVQQTAHREIFWLESRLRWFKVLSQIGPAVGLLGTLLGLYQVLQKTALQGPYSSGDALLSLIARALSASLWGSLLGLLTYLAYYFFSSKIDWLIHHIQQAISELESAKKSASHAALHSSPPSSG